MFANKKHEEAHLALKEEKLEYAVKLYTEAIALNPESVDILADRAVAYLHLEMQKESLSDFDKAAELEPNKAYRYASRAFAKRHFKDIDGAVKDYTIAVELDPEDEIAHNNLGLLLEEQGRHQAAKERFDQADSLSKQENSLLNVIDELDGESNKEIKVVDDKKKEEPKASVGSELAKTVSSKKQFKEFISFVKNGFKIK